MAKYIIKPGQANDQVSFTGKGSSLKVAELFTDAFQGEGAYAGCPAIFLRLGGCHLGCDWCDSREIWKKIQTIDVTSLVDLFVKKGLLAKLNEGYHLVVTGGAPLLQQTALMDFLVGLQNESKKSKIFVEIENEASCEVSPENNMLLWLIDCWNNSPKLVSSGVKHYQRYSPGALMQASSRPAESWFKFVITGEEDWEDIEQNYLKPGYIKRSQVILMPEGQTREELTPEKKQMVAELAIKHGVRFSTRLQIDIYNDKKGV